MKRRDLLIGSAAFTVLPFLTPLLINKALAVADLPLNKKLYGLSLYGDLKYPADFTHFDYVNPDAPKGGKIITNYMLAYYNQSWGTFNTLNGFTLKGDAPMGMYFTVDTLMKSTADEPASLYCWLAKQLELTDDGNVWNFYINPAAKFHDGSPVTAADIVFSFNLIRDKGHPNIKTAFKDVQEINAEGDKVTITYNGRQKISDCFSLAGAVPIFSRQGFAGRDFATTTLEPLPTSGAYGVGDFAVGKYIEYQRVKNYWARHLPVNKGFNNFDIIRFEFFRDQNSSLVALKKGVINFRIDLSPKSWNTTYDVPAVKDGRISKIKLPLTPKASMRGLFFNLRRPKLQNIKLRQALTLLYDFEWFNKNIFYDLYKRLESPLGDPGLYAKGKPSAAELKLMEPYRDDIPQAAFAEVVHQPVSDGSGSDRKLLRQATELLKEAGYQNKQGKLYDKSGKRLDIEILITDPQLETQLTQFVKNLQSVGVDVVIRLVDAAQYQLRRSNFDYDMTLLAFDYGGYPDSSAIEIFFGSASANRKGGYNISGVSNRFVDHIINELGKAKSLAEAGVVLSAFDRVIRSMYIMIPTYYRPNFLIAMWDMFAGMPQLPKYGDIDTILASWWYDKKKAEKVDINKLWD